MTAYSPPRHRALRTCAFAFLVGLAGSLLAGCGGPKGTVTGVVKYKNRIVKGGTVTIISKDSKFSGQSEIGEDGTYSISEVPVGEVQISVETASAKPSASAQQYQYKPPKEAGPEASNFTYNLKPKERYVEIPESYNNPNTSGLTYTVTAGGQEHPIDLK